MPGEQNTLTLEIGFRLELDEEHAKTLAMERVRNAARREGREIAAGTITAEVIRDAGLERIGQYRVKVTAELVPDGDQ